MNKIRLLMLIFLILSLSGCTPKGCSFLPKTSLEILQYNLEKTETKGEWTAQIVGVARNSGDAKLEYAEVIGKFYSQDGALLATGFAATISEEEKEEGKPFTLDPGQIWEFTISFPTEREAHKSLNILSGRLQIDSSGARIIGEAENNGDVILSFAEITGTFYDVAGILLALVTDTTTRLGIGEIWKFTIFYPGQNFEDVDHFSIVVTDIDCYEMIQQEVDHVTVEVGTLKGSTRMP